jgi:hypothetical protein
MGLEHSIGADERLDSGNGSFSLHDGGDIFEQAELAARSRQVGRCQTETNHPSRHTRRFHPGPNLPPDPFAQGLGGERIVVSPDPGPNRPVDGLGFDEYPMGGDTMRIEQFHERVGHGAGGKPDLFEQREGVFKALLDRQFLRDVSRQTRPTLTACERVGLNTDRAEAGRDRRSRKPSQRAQCVDTQPPERGDQVVRPDRSDVDLGQESSVVINGDKCYVW